MDWQVGDIISIGEAKKYDVIAFTANSYVTADFRLVMGAGAAKRVLRHYPGIDAEFGTRIRVGELGFEDGLIYPPHGVQKDYLVAGVPRAGIIIAAVQVKQHFRDHTEPEAKDLCWELTVKSLAKLRRWCERHPDKRVVMNCPLIGFGGYGDQEERVRIMTIEALRGTSVTICTLPN